MISQLHSNNSAAGTLFLLKNILVYPNGGLVTVENFGENQYLNFELLIYFCGGNI